jgi:hypothetical protein
VAVTWVSGMVMIDARTAGTIAAALRMLEELHKRRSGGQLSAPVRQVQLQFTELAAAYADAVGDADGIASPTAMVIDTGLPHDLIDTATAALILGCSAHNVRGLCRRGTLPAERRAGVWILSRTEVERYRDDRGY